MAFAQQGLRQGRVDVALERLSSLPSSHPECVQVVLMRVQVYAIRGEALFVRASELAPLRPEPYFELGMLDDGRQQHGSPADQFRRVLSIARSDPQAYDYLGLSLEALGEFS